MRLEEMERENVFRLKKTKDKGKKKAKAESAKMVQASSKEAPQVEATA